MCVVQISLENLSQKYQDLGKEELIGLLKARDLRDAQRFGLIWEANEIEREKAINNDFVSVQLDPALSVGVSPWKNLLIEGDNFDALRFLRMAFSGRIRCIYIDPPYNTGNRDFVYNDRFVDKEDLWRHSRWAEFMYQRLVLARDLLTPDGVIVVSIDDNEVHTLGMLMNRVFGENAFIATCIWQKRYSRENRGAIGDAHEYLVFYSPRPELFKLRRGRIPLSEDQAKVYKNSNDDPNGPWATVSMNAQGFRPNQMYDIVAPNGKVHRPPEGRCWAMLEGEFQKLKAQGKIHWGKDGNGVPRIIRYLKEVDGLVPWTWWPHDEVGHTDEARKEIQSIFGTQTAFDTPKPVRLIERVLQICCGSDDIVLDFFAGSGTTAHAVHKLNSQDGGKRRSILVSSSEATIEEPGKNLCKDVCAVRLKKVIEGFKDSEGENFPGLGGDFAYLRCNRTSASDLVEISHEQVWTAIQLIHTDTLSPYVACDFLIASNDDQTLVYVPRFSNTIVDRLKSRIEQANAVILYSWQPETLRQHIVAPHVQHEGIPESLARRFGLRTTV